MTKPFLLALSAYLWVCGSQAHAQDLLGAAASATRSYSFAEIKYLPELDSNLPIWVEVVYEVKNQWSIWGQYRKQKFENVGPDDEFKLVADTDWVAGLRVGDLDAEVVIQDLVIAADTRYYEGYIGLRRSFSARAEGEAGVVHNEPDEGDSITSGSLKLVYRVKPAIDIALSIDNISEEEELATGLTYTW